MLSQTRSAVKPNEASERARPSLTRVSEGELPRHSVVIRIAALIFRVLAFDQFAKRATNAARFNVYEN